MLTMQPQTDLTAVKSRQQATWAAGDYAVIGTTLALTGELLCEAVQIRPDQRVLDVAAGNGTGEIHTVTFSNGGSPVATLTLAYDASNRITTVTKS